MIVSLLGRDCRRLVVITRLSESLPDADSFYHSRQQFQIILSRMELLVDDLKIEPRPSPETVQKYLEAILASMQEYAKFLSDLQRTAKIEEKEELSKN